MITAPFHSTGWKILKVGKCSGARPPWQRPMSVVLTHYLYRDLTIRFHLIHSRILRGMLSSAVSMTSVHVRMCPLYPQRTAS